MASTLLFSVGEKYKVYYNQKKREYFCQSKIEDSEHFAFVDCRGQYRLSSLGLLTMQKYLGHPFCHKLGQSYISLMKYIQIRTYYHYMKNKKHTSPIERNRCCYPVFDYVDNVFGVTISTCQHFTDNHFIHCQFHLEEIAEISMGN